MQDKNVIPKECSECKLIHQQQSFSAHVRTTWDANYSRLTMGFYILRLSQARQQHTNTQETCILSALKYLSRRERVFS